MRIITLLMLALFFSSCEETVGDIDIDYGYAYFPLEIGKFVEFKVDSIIYDPSALGIDIDTTHSFVKEELVDKNINDEGNEVYTIHRSWKSNATDTYQVMDVWTVHRTSTQSVRTEENLPFINLVFPIRSGRSWDGTTFIDQSTIVFIAGETMEFFKSWDSYVKAIDREVTYNGLTFNDVVEVSHADSENLIEKRCVIEQYAKGIGLIFKSQMILDTQCNGDLTACDDIPWEIKAEKGIILEQSILDHN